MSEPLHDGHDATGANETVQEALVRARRHARNAAAEATRALRALLDALSLLQGGVAADSHAVLSRAAVWLDTVARGLGGSDDDAALTRALAEALDAEIARWEARASEDPDARAVLRAFLGLRELLWELGVRPRPSAGPSEGEAPAARPRAGRRKRVERVTVQG
ncbi:MAG: hypothetical protein ACQGVC_20730 [Myxococcota bacterium]